MDLTANGGRALLLRGENDWRVAGGYAAGALIALGLFVATRLVVGKCVALIAIGVTPFIALALPESLQLNVERRGHPFACGLVCLALSLAAGIAGPILDLFFVRSKMTRHAVVATKAMTQSLSHLLKIVYFGPVLERISDTAFRQWTRWTVMTLGAVYLGSGVNAWLNEVHTAIHPLLLR